MLAVNYWKPAFDSQVGVNIGHVSLSLDGAGSGDGYVSFWPVADGLADAALVMLDLPVRAEHVSFDEDKSREGGGPDQVEKIGGPGGGLDEAAIRKQWAFLRDRMRYQFLSNNCATVIAHLLHSGGGSLSLVTGTVYMTSFAWSPAEVLNYARIINENMDEIGRRVRNGEAPDHPAAAQVVYSHRSRQVLQERLLTRLPGRAVRPT